MERKKNYIYATSFYIGMSSIYPQDVGRHWFKLAWGIIRDDGICNPAIFGRLYSYFPCTGQKRHIKSMSHCHNIIRHLPFILLSTCQKTMAGFHRWAETLKHGEFLIRHIIQKKEWLFSLCEWALWIFGC